MTYATQADLVARFGATELALRTDRADGTTIDTVVVERALQDADAEINSYLAGRYALPLTSTPAVLQRLACDMARYYLFQDGVNAMVRQRYEDAVSLLKRMANGDVQLGDDALGAANTAPAAVDVTYHSFSARQITDDSTQGFA